MKILAINGSPRKKKNTGTLLQCVLEGAAKAGAETSLVQLADLHFGGCMSCFACKRINGPSYGRCARKDDLTPVLQQAHEADVLVLGSPFYYSAETALLRACEERLWFQYNRYAKDGKSLSPAKKVCALLFTMNVTEELIPKYPHKGSVISTNKGFMERTFSCPCEIFCCYDTLQYDDYSKYEHGIFDAQHKRERHAAVFPQEMERARAFGRQLVS